MAKDLYGILGIERSADSRGVHEAYRRLAKRSHPDCAGEGGTGKFREIQEAYVVLSDAHKRRSYDTSLARKRQTYDREWDNRLDLGRVSRLDPHRPEPLVPTTSAEPLGSHVQPPRFFSPGGKKPAEIEIVLHWHEAAGGVTVRLPIPMISRCPACSRIEMDHPFLPCRFCGGTGTVEDEIDVNIALPSGIRDGTIVDIPEIRMSHLATRSMRLHVRVEPW
jgi:DnaJ-class molecular chaperone